MRRLIAALGLVGLLGTGMMAFANAQPGDNGNNTHGLCTAYFNGQKNGWNKDGKPSPGPFADLESRANQGHEHDTPEQVATNVRNYCDMMGATVGGNPNENGRFVCTDGSPNSTADYTCTTNTSPKQKH